MNTFFEHNRILLHERHAKMLRDAEHARLVRTVLKNRKHEPNRFARMMQTITNGFAAVMQRTQHRNARRASGHAR